MNFRNKLNNSHIKPFYFLKLPFSGIRTERSVAMNCKICRFVCYPIAKRGSVDAELAANFRLVLRFLEQFNCPKLMTHFKRASFFNGERI